ncbi:tRNA-splicing endonuclease [Salix suchowensis]|nr:tRNA-splicing endonuclease [Salix suchowensis]
MAEVIVKKGKLWITTGILALVVMDDNDVSIALKDIYGKIACRQLKFLGYVVGRHGVSWSLKNVYGSCSSCSFQWMIKSEGMLEIEQNDTTSIAQMLCNLLVDELKPNFEIYLPNRNFRKSSPCGPTFQLWLIRGNPPSRTKNEALERQSGRFPSKSLGYHCKECLNHCIQFRPVANAIYE